MLLQGTIGPQTLQNEASANLSVGKSAEAFGSSYQGRYYQLCYAGKVYNSCLQASTALSTLSTTYTGLMITNPVGTGFNCVMLQCCIAVSSAPAGISTMHHEGTKIFQPTAVTQGTPNTVQNMLLGNLTLGVGLAASASTPPATPVALRAIGGGTNATGSVQCTDSIIDEIAGAMILAPGTYIGLGYLTTAISVIASYHWAELPQ